MDAAVGLENLTPPQLQWAQYSILKTSFKTSRNLAAELRNDLLLVRGPATRPPLWRREDHRRERTMALGKYNTAQRSATLPERRELHLALYDYGQRPGFRVMDSREP